MRLKPGKIEAEDVRGLLALWEDLKAQRVPFEAAWHQIAQWVDPRHDFSLDKVNGALRTRMMVDTTAPESAERLAALLHGFMMSPYDPWVKPYVPRLGREPRYEENVWFQSVQEDMHDFLTSTRSTFRSQSHESLISDVTYGTSILWQGISRRTRQPFFKCLPLSECWIAEDDEGNVDTLIREFRLPLRNALKFAPTAKLKEKAERPNANMAELITFLWFVVPRDGAGVQRGAMAGAKPYASIVLCATTDNEVALQEGYDEFPFAVTRFHKRSGEVYGRGPGWMVLPNAKFLNAMKETIIRAAEQEADPALIDLTGEYQTLDRRPGALNRLPTADMGLLDPDQIVRRVVERSDVGLTVELVRDVRQNIKELNFIDWMSMGNGERVTAEFVRDRRDLRLRALSPIVSRGEQEKLMPVADRTFTLMQAADMLEPPPQSLDGRPVEFDYDSPLARVQKSSRVESAERALYLTERAVAIDPEAVDEIDVPAILRDAVGDSGLSERHKRRPEDIQRRRADRRRQIEAQQNAENAEREARAAAAAGQGMANVAGIGQGV